MRAIGRGAFSNRVNLTKNGWHGSCKIGVMIRKIRSGGYRLYSRKRNPATGKHRRLGTFRSLEAAERHECQVQFFKRD